MSAFGNEPSSRRGARISFEDVTKTFVDSQRAHTALAPVDLTIEPGELVTFLGPSGCGKSTLLNMAAGVIEPTGGTIRFNGKAIAGLNPNVGYMTQRDNLLPWRTVAANIRLPLELRHLRRRQRDAIVDAMIETVGLTAFAKHYPAELSGGMQKRVALGRALVQDAPTYLMDEPFGALDAQLRASLQQMLLSIWEAHRKTLIFVTHDIEEAILLSDRIVIFGTKPGRVIHVEEVPLSRPRTLVQVRTEPSAVDMWARIWELIGTDQAHDTTSEWPRSASADTSSPDADLEAVS